MTPRANRAWELWWNTPRALVKPSGRRRRTKIWDYTAFSRAEGAGEPLPEPDGRIPLVFRAKWAGNRWVDHWTINGKEYPKTDPIQVRATIATA